MTPGAPYTVTVSAVWTSVHYKDCAPVMWKGRNLTLEPLYYRSSESPQFQSLLIPIRD